MTEKSDNNHIYSEEWASKNLRDKKWVDEFCELLIKEFNPKSIIDFGCGTGDILAPFEKKRLKIKGLDGSKGASNHLKIKPENFLLFDLRNIYSTDIKYDLCVSLEVAEHIEKQFNEVFVDNLTNTSSTIILTACDGEQSDYHPNPQPKSYWIGLFEKRGFVFDNEKAEILKNQMKHIEGLQNWYIDNLMVFRKK